MSDPLELIARREDGRVLLCAPDAGRFTEPVDRGHALAPGQDAGALLRLGRATRLIVPPGVAGRVVSPPLEAIHAPVGHGQVLYEVDPTAAADADAGDEAAGEGTDGLVVRAPQSGRFYHRPSPDADALCAPGMVVEEGQPVGLLEIMKTFSHIGYSASAGLPPKARILRVVAQDGTEVSRGDALLEVEPA